MKERKFAVIQGQVEVEYVEIVHHSRGSVVIEIGTKQKYPQVVAYSSVELHIAASENTREDSYDKEQQATTIMFPHRYYGWDVLPEWKGRYTLRVGLYGPDKQRSGNLMEIQTQEWRIARLTAEDLAWS